MKTQKLIPRLFITLALGFSLSPVAFADPVTVNYQGNNYTITSQNTNYDTNPSLLTSQPWWGNASLSLALTDLVKFDAGNYLGPGSVLGALFGYGINGSYVSITYWNGGSTIDCPMFCPITGDNYYYATLISMVPDFTLASVAESLKSTGSGLNSTVSSINLMINGAHSRPMSRRVAVGEKTTWIAGDIGRDDHDNNSGSLGMAEIGGGYNFGPAQVNLSVGHTWAKQDLVFSGNVDAGGEYLMLESIIPLSEANGLYATIGGFGHWGEADIRRGYLNAGNLQTSTASPDTHTWGLRARLDWENAFVAKSVELSPYVDLNYYKSHMEGYTETGGGLQARFDGRNDERTDVTIGLNAAKPITGTNLNLVANVGAVHSFNDRGARTSGELVGLFGFNLDGDKLDTDWVRAGAGVEGMIGKGKASLMVNGTTEGQMSNLWMAASYQLAF